MEVIVRRRWNGRDSASVPIGAISDLHWSKISGGVQVRAQRPFLHGYIRCDDIIDGELAHSCRHGPPPHSIKICIVKKDNIPAVMARLISIAGPCPKNSTKKKA